MCSPTLNRQTAARMTSLVQIASSEISCLEREETTFHPVRMDWVLVADTKGNARPRMRWLVD